MIDPYERAMGLLPCWAYSGCTGSVHERACPARFRLVVAASFAELKEELDAVDSVLSRRSALERIPDRVGKIQQIINIASALEKEVGSLLKSQLDTSLMLEKEIASLKTQLKVAFTRSVN